MTRRPWLLPVAFAVVGGVSIGLAADAIRGLDHRADENADDIAVLSAQLEAEGIEPAVEAPAEIVPVPGPQGEPGEDGDDGAPGVDGKDGAAGTPGQRGTAGATGAAGASGEPGAAGTVGPQGEQGPQGIPGPEGKQGPAGPQGPPVQSFTWTFGLRDWTCTDPDGDGRYVCEPT